MHGMHMLFMFSEIFKNLKLSFSVETMRVKALDVFIENATKMV